MKPITIIVYFLCSLFCFAGGSSPLTEDSPVRIEKPFMVTFEANQKFIDDLIDRTREILLKSYPKIEFRGADDDLVDPISIIQKKIDEEVQLGNGYYELSDLNSKKAFVLIIVSKQIAGDKETTYSVILQNINKNMRNEIKKILVKFEGEKQIKNIKEIAVE